MSATRFGPFCRHHWQEVGRSSKEPAGSVKFGGGLLPVGIDLADLIYGYTVIEQRCEHCGHARNVKLTATR